MSDYDLVVIGHGAAGLSAAIAFSEACRDAGEPGRVALLESASQSERGGATRETTSRFRVSSDGRLDPRWVETQQSASKGLSDRAQCELVAREAPNALAFLQEHGVQVEHLVEDRVAMDFNTGGNFGQPVGGGKAIVEGFSTWLEQLDGVEFHYETEALRLRVSEAGRVDGVVVRGPDGLLRTLGVDAVVVASGGFEGNPEMLTKYMGPRATALKLIAPGVRFNKGAGLRMAMEIGADTAGQFDGMHGELVDRRTTRADAVIYTHNLGIVVNDDCRRFFDEGYAEFTRSFEVIAYEVWRNQNQSAYFITDQTVLDFELDWVFDSDIPPVKADTIRELAGFLGLDPGALEETVGKFNAACPRGTLDPSVVDGQSTKGLDPPKSNWAHPLDKPPFYAYPLTTAITFTYGGLKVDTSSRVLSTNNVPIPGLYAAGEVIGLWYNEYICATSVLRSLITGRIAGAHAAQHRASLARAVV